MSAKIIVTLLATSFLTVGCVAYTDDPYYRGGDGHYGYDWDDDYPHRYDRDDERRAQEWERKRWEQRQKLYEQQRKDIREREKDRREWEKKHREWQKKQYDERNHHHDHDD